MLSKVKSFVDRHKKKFMVAGVIIGSTIMTTQYLKRKLIEMQQQQTLEFLEQSRRMQHFESTEKTCNQAIKGLNSKLCDQILIKINTKKIIQQLRSKPENKIELWNEIKMLSLTRIATFIYASTILVITLRIQLNLLGGYLYKDTTKVTNNQISEEIRQNFLTSIQYFLNEGLSNLIVVIERKVREVMAHNSLSQNVTLADIEQLFWSLQMMINSHFEQESTKISKYVFPSDVVNKEGILREMFIDTIDMLDSEDVSVLFSGIVSSGFSITVDNISEFYSDNLKNEKSPVRNKSSISKIVNINELRMPLAKLIPIINGLTSKGIDSTTKSTNLPTTISTYILVSDKIKMLGANVYEVFSI